MRRTLAIAMAVVAAVGAASAYDFKAANEDGMVIYYNVMQDSKSCEVTSGPSAESRTGAEGEGLGDYSGSVKIPAKVTYRGKAYAVSGIGEYAFSECYYLTSVSFPEGVTSIGDFAFESCTTLESIALPHSLRSIGVGAFEMCTSLTSVTIPDRVTSIWRLAFNGCDRLKSFSGKFASSDGRCLVVDGVLTAFAPAGLTSYKIPADVTVIGESVFNTCVDLTSVTIPEGVTEIGTGAFGCCYGLTSVTLPSSLVFIGEDAFSGCPIRSIVIPDGVVSIGQTAFELCTDLTSVTIPASVITIGEGAFESCANLTSVTIASRATIIGEDAFANCPKLQRITYLDDTPGASYSRDASEYDFDFERYHQAFLDKAELAYCFSDDDIRLVSYALIDIDGDGQPEVWVKGDSGQNYQGIYAVDGDDVIFLASGDLVFYDGAVGFDNYWDGEEREGATILKNSRPAGSFSRETHIDRTNGDETVDPNSCYVDGLRATPEACSTFARRLGDRKLASDVEGQLIWHRVK